MLFWRTQTRDAARIGRLKYLNDGTGERLLDLGTDPGEKVDLRQKNEGIFARIKAEYEAWNARMLPRFTA